jgi:hypothetical protein
LFTLGCLNKLVIAAVATEQAGVCGHGNTSMALFSIQAVWATPCRLLPSGFPAPPVQIVMVVSADFNVPSNFSKVSAFSRVMGLL